MTDRKVCEELLPCPRCGEYQWHCRHSQPVAEGATPRTNHYRTEFKRRKETSDLIEWMLDEFEQTERDLAAAREELERVKRERDDFKKMHEKLSWCLKQSDDERLGYKQRAAQADSRLLAVAEAVRKACILAVKNAAHRTVFSGDANAAAIANIRALSLPPIIEKINAESQVSQNLAASIGGESCVSREGSPADSAPEQNAGKGE